MITWDPITPSGFLIEVDARFNFIQFIEQPIGNTKTFDEVLAENRAVSPPPQRELTQSQIDKEVSDQYIRENDIKQI